MHPSITPAYTCSVSPTRRQLLLIPICLLSAFLAGCCSTGSQTAGELARASKTPGYKPLDPLPVEFELNSDPKLLLASLPDETMRLATGFDYAGAGVTYGPIQTGVEGSNYVVVLDYIKYTTAHVLLSRERGTNSSGKAQYKLATEHDQADVVIPVYVGVGVRMEASFTVLRGRVNIGTLAAVSAAAEAGSIQGRLVLQTLGLSGPSISSAMTIASDLNPVTIQNALISLGTVKSKMYDSILSKSDTRAYPRAVAIYDTIGGGSDTINQVISLLLKEPLYLDVQTGKVSHTRATRSDRALK